MYMSRKTNIHVFDVLRTRTASRTCCRHLVGTLHDLLQHGTVQFIANNCNHYEDIQFTYRITHVNAKHVQLNGGLNVEMRSD